MEDYINQRIKVNNNGCWIWQLTPSETYGRANHSGKQVYAHRLSYEYYGGQIPEGLQIDHLCRNRKCVNPDHLEPVTLKENVLRGIGISANNAKKTLCKNGHELEGYNLIVRPRGRRTCRTCNVRLSREWRARKRYVMEGGL